MMSIDEIFKLARAWDEQEIMSLSGQGTTGTGATWQGSFRDRLDYIHTLAEFRYVPYLNDEIQDFYGKLWIWLKQFETDSERRLAFKLVSRLTFITEDQIRYLQEVCYQEKLQYHLLNEIVREYKLSPYNYSQASKYLGTKLQQCLFVPLTDSARYNQFVHVNNLENHSNLGLQSIEVLVHPDIRNTPEAVQKLKERYANKSILVVLEDFCGSGKTFISDLARICSLYSNFEKVYFCPYIITQRAEDAITRFAHRYTPRIWLEILYGMRISNRLRVFSPSSDLFSFDEQQALKAMCLKYHLQYFSSHRFIGVPRSYPFGYRDGQLLVVMQSNCPNHSLPIIWAQDNGWYPLFKRIQRYA